MFSELSRYMFIKLTLIMSLLDLMREILFSADSESDGAVSPLRPTSRAEGVCMCVYVCMGI